MPTTQTLSQLLDELRGIVQSSPEHLRSKAESAVELARSLGDASQLESALLLRAIGGRMVGLYNEAYHDFVEAIHIAIEHHHDQNIFGLSAQLGDLLYDMTDYRHAERLFRAILASSKLSTPNIRLLVLLSRGKNFMKLGELPKAVSSLSSALELAAAMGEERSLNWAMHLLGTASLLRGNPVEARDRYEQCRRYYQHTQQIANIVAADIAIAEAFVAENNFAAAEASLGRALVLAQEHNLSKLSIDIFHQKATVALSRGDKELSRKFLSRAHAIALKGNTVSDLVEIYAKFQKIYETLGDGASAQKYRKFEYELIERHERESKKREEEIAGITKAISQLGKG